MKRSLYLLSIFLMIGFLSGCASMSKKECINANWHSIGYTDGSRGVHYNNLAKHHQSCVKHEIIPDDNAYHAGWDQGIRSYCTADNGYRAGRAGKAYRNICPQDVEANFLSGWEQGIRHYCTPENGLQVGLAGRQYRGVCPADMEPAFHDYYRLGRDVRKVRSTHTSAENSVSRVERALTAEQDPQRHRNLLHELERLQHDEDRQDGILAALEACMSDDWFDAGYFDGETGYARRAGDIANVCRSYGVGMDRGGYHAGWEQGNSYYCTYNSGLYVGQTNQRYSGVCSGIGHRRFWRGYEEGRRLYQSGRYGGHPKPENRKVIRHPNVQKRQYQKHNRPAEIRPERDVLHKQRGMEQSEDVKRGYRDRETDSSERERSERDRSERELMKRPHDNREREMRQPPERSRAADPVEKREMKEPHDNRDKLKHPMPVQSKKPEPKEKKDHDDDDEQDKMIR